MIHAHMTAWFLALILFFVSYGLHKAGKEKGSKIVQMILRLFYLLILLTGAVLLLGLESISIMYIFKATVGLWVIALLELILTRTKKDEKVSILWIQFAVALLLVLYLGFSLPLGTELF